MTRCSRCHSTPPNPNGCALCNPVQIGIRLTEALARVQELERELALERAVNFGPGEWVPVEVAHQRDQARAELARIRPVYEAAKEWREHGPGQSHCAEEDCPCTSTVCRLKDAITTAE